MRALLVSGGKPDSAYPLNGNFEFEQAVALAAAGIDVYFFAVDLRSIRRKRSYGISKGVEDGVKWYVISLPLGAIPITILCKIGSITLRYLFSKVFKLKGDYPDVIHAHFTEMGCIAADLSTKKNIPLVVTEHSSAMNKPTVDPNLLKCAIKGYSKASKVIAVSKPLSESIYSKTGIQAVVIPNMIKLDVFTKCQKKEHNGFHIVSVGAMIPRKRFANLIKAVADVLKIHDDIYLHIIGDGYMREELKQQVADLKIDNRVIFHGYKNASEITNIYETCDCFALVSASETFGVVYVEAMAAGLPVIATRCGGPEDFVNEKNGLLLEVDNHQQLCNALEYIYVKAATYHTDEIRETARNNSPEVVSNKIIEVYNEVC